MQTETPVRIALLLPHTTGRSLVAVRARRWLSRIDRAIEQVAAASPRTTAVVVAPAETATVGEVVLDRDHYASCAALLLPIVLDAVGEARAVG